MCATSLLGDLAYVVLEPTPLQWTPNVKDHSRAVSDSSTSSTCNSLLTWPSSVHIADVTHGPCAAYEHTSSHGVSETANETNVNCGIILCDTEGMSCSALQSNGSPRKRPPVTINDTSAAVSHPSKRLHQEPNNKSHIVHPIMSFSRLKEYIEQTNTAAKTVMEDNKNIKWNVAQHDIFQYVKDLIELCKPTEMLYMHQSLVILERIVNDSDECEDVSTSNKERLSPENFFANNKVVRLIALERTLKTGQVYVASGLSMKFHFSSPTVLIPSLYEAIQCTNNPNMKLTFVPRMATLCNIEGGIIKVLNNIEFEDTSIYEECHDIHNAIVGKQSSLVTKALGTTSKRSKYSISIGLQMMHSHTQHLARFCMLSHLKPHVPNVKTVPGVITDRIISMYALISDIISESLNYDDMHPFALNVTNTPGDAFSHRKALRIDLPQHFSSRMAYDIDPQTMFESCSLHPTASLGFHVDTLNCLDMDNTIACFVPCLSRDDTDDLKCLSFLFYSRKCVGGHVKRMTKIEEYIRNPKANQLAKLCVGSIMHVGGIFDYQGSLFEATDLMNTISKKNEM